MKEIILITGASSDIGLALIPALPENSIVLAHYHSSDQVLRDLASHARCELVPLQADFSDEASVQAMIDTIEQRYGTPSKIVHLAAPKFGQTRFKDIAWDSLQREMDVSVRSVFAVLQRFLPRMAKEKRGKVITMLSSVTLNVPPKALARYTTVKYALLGLMKSLASEYADRGVTVNCISPSMIDTKFLSDINEKFVEIAAESHPLKRNATVNDVVPAIVLLLSEGSDYINGINLPVTGGSIF